MKSLFFTLFCAFFVVIALPAQTSSLTSVADNSSNLMLDSDDWSFFADDDSRVLFIDFEKIKVNLSDISVKSEVGEIVFKEDVWQLPVNTIFEVDYATFKPGTYQVEIRSFTGVIKRELVVR